MFYERPMARGDAVTPVSRHIHHENLREHTTNKELSRVTRRSATRSLAQTIEPVYVGGGRDRSLPFEQYQGTRTSAYARLWKRVFDVAFCVALLPVLLPICAALMLLVRLDGGPGVFGHTRVGRGGRSFKCYKFRTMIPDNAQILQDYLDANPDARKEWEEQRKLTNDPRITRIGNVLRKTSLDELPQIWNVLRGEMSLVGPRPVPADELERYGLFKSSYMSVSPGMTGIWQVHGRNTVSYTDRVRMDTTYSQSFGFLPDVWLILQTVLVLFKVTGK